LSSRRRLKLDFQNLRKQECVSPPPRGLPLHCGARSRERGDAFPVTLTYLAFSVSFLAILRNTVLRANTTCPCATDDDDACRPKPTHRACISRILLGHGKRGGGHVRPICFTQPKKRRAKPRVVWQDPVGRCTEKRRRNPPQISLLWIRGGEETDPEISTKPPAPRGALQSQDAAITAKIGSRQNHGS